MFGLTAVPAVRFCVGTAYIPESPRWLATRGHRDRASRVLEQIGGPHYTKETYREIESGMADAGEKPRLRDLLDPRMRKVIVLGVTLAVFQQWCGINVIFNYAEEIFRAAGYDVSSVLMNITWTGSVNLVFTLAAFAFVDQVGRRPLMLIGAGGLAAVYGIMGIGYHGGVQGLPMLLLVLAAIAFSAMSLAPVTWVVISEIFPNRTVDRVLYPDLHVPNFEPQARACRNVLALCRHLRRGFHLHRGAIARDEGQIARTAGA